MTDITNIVVNTGNTETPRALFHKDFTLVVIGQIISLFGNAILRFALPLYILKESGSASLFGLVSASAFLPMIIMSPIGGIIADRVNKQRIMVVLDFFTAALIMVFILISGEMSLVPLVVVVLMALYGIQGAYSPAVQASIPLLAEGDRIVPANAVVNLVQSLSSLLGPVIGGILYAAYGLTPILIVSVICFFISAVMELFIHIPHQPRTESRSIFAIVKDDMSLSLHFILKDKPVLAKGILLICGFNLFLSSMLVIGLPVLITQTLGLSDQLYGIAQGALAAGGLAGGIFAGVLGNKLDIRHSHILMLVSAIGIIPMGLTLLLGAPPFVSYLVITVMSFFLMVCATLFSIQMLAFAQVQTPTELTGKVISFMMALSMCSQPIGQALYGILFEKLAGLPWVVVMGAAVISVLIALYSKSTFSKIRDSV